MKAIALCAALLLPLLLSTARVDERMDHSLNESPDAELCSQTVECRANPRVVGKCFTVRGRMNFWNGTPSTRIWMIGTHRMLGLPCEDSGLPKNVRKHFNDFDDEVTALMKVCPFDKYHKGEMQMVCVQSMSRIKFRHAHR